MLESRVADREDFRVMIAYPNYTMMLTPSYAVGLFTSILKGQKYNVDLFDCTPYMTSHNPQELPNVAVLTNKLLANKPFDPSFFKDVKTDLLGDFGRKLDDFNPHAVVFSTVTEDTWPQTRDLLRVLSERPHIRSIVGGVFTTMAPRNVISSEYVQCIGLGEGEGTVVDFCEAVRNGAPTQNIPGTWSRDRDGNITYNHSRPLVDLDKTPVPDFSLFDPKRFQRPLGARKDWRAIPIETYRGCPYTCTFCNSPTQKTLAEEREQGFFLRRKSMDTLRTEITALLQQNDGNFLYINDDAFMARPKSEIVAFADMYKDIAVPFWIQTRFEDITEEHLEMLAKVGLYRISFGLEHGNEEFRRKYLLRNISNEKMIEKSKIVERVGIPYSVNVILGMPYETRDLVFDTIRTNRQLGGFDSAAPNIFTPYHGTRLRELAIQEGWLDPDLQTNSFVGGSLLNMPPPYLSAEEMLRLQRTYNLYLTFPESRWPEIESVEKMLGTDEGEALWSKLKDEFYQKKYGMTEEQRKMTYAG